MMDSIEDSLNSILDKIILIVALLSLFSIIISILLISIIIFVNTIEQTKDIAVLRTLGIGAKEVVMIFIYQSLLIGFIAFLVALSFVIFIVTQVNITFKILLNTNDDVVFLDVKVLLVTFGTLLLISLISGFFPAISAAKRDSLRILQEN